MGKVRDFLLPWVTGRTALLGPEFAQQYRCLVLDWFFRFFPFLGSGLHYDILVPLHAWFLGDVATVQLLLSLAIAFFACNALKDLLMLPRPRASVHRRLTSRASKSFTQTHTRVAQERVGISVQSGFRG